MLSSYTSYFSLCISTFTFSVLPPESIMASWVFSECGLKPFPSIYTQHRAGLGCTNNNKSTKIRFLRENVDSCLLRSSRGRNWGLKVSAPITFETFNEEDSTGDNEVSEEDEFDPGAAPPFKLSDIRAAIPKHCFVKNAWRSMSYVVRDIMLVFGLAAGAAYLNNWFVWPLYWFAQGTMFWALFVLGHDW